MKKVDIKYLAGLFDGEGSVITFKKNIQVPKVRIQISNTCFEVLSDVKRSFGGNLQPKRKHKKFINIKNSYAIMWSGTKAVKLLVLLLPYLRIKRKQAEIAVTCPFVGSGHRLSEFQRMKRFMIKEKLHELNK